MKIIKNLMRYDLEKSTQLCKLGDDNDAQAPVLYKTEKGNYFSYCERTNELVVLGERDAALKLEEVHRIDLLEQVFPDFIVDA